MNVKALTFMARRGIIRDMKDCSIIFRDNQIRPYEFSSSDLPKALDWSQDKPVQCIKTPWGVLQRWDNDEYDTIMSTFSE